MLNLSVRKFQAFIGAEVDLILKKVKNEQDVQIIGKCFFSIFPEEAHYDLADFKISIAKKRLYMQHDYYIAYQQQNVVGFCGIYADNKEECWLGWLGVIPEFRRRGIASKMLNRLYKKMQKKGYKICRVYTDKVINHNAYNMYLKHGFVEDSLYRINFVTMYKLLDDNVVAKKWQGIPLGFESEDPE